MIHSDDIDPEVSPAFTEFYARMFADIRRVLDLPEDCDINTPFYTMPYSYARERLMAARKESDPIPWGFIDPRKEIEE